MQKVLLTITIALSLTVSTIVIICSLDGIAVCTTTFDNTARFHVYKNYCVLPYILRNQFEANLSIYDRITLTFHLSYNYLDRRIIEQVQAWDGPITLAIMVNSNDVFANIRDVESRLSMLPRDITKKLSCHIVFRSDVGCEMNAITQMENSQSFEYPVNVARNVARMFVRSKYVLMADYEYVFSEGFEQRMIQLAQTELALRPKTALVFRIFEADASVPKLPRKKTELEQLMKTGKAIEFHAKYAQNAHKIPGLSKWFERPEGNGSATIFSEVPYKRRDWEPQFVSLNTIPMHDENFPFSIRDNTVLRWEMCRMGYRYVVVDDLFMIHRGIKTSRDVFRTRAFQMNVRTKFNSALIKFNKRMDEEFPETKQKCPHFDA